MLDLVVSASPACHFQQLINQLSKQITSRQHKCVLKVIKTQIVVVLLLKHISGFDPFAENVTVTLRPAETISEPKAERPKPPSSLLTDTLQASAPKQIPIVSPDRSLLSTTE